MTPRTPSPPSNMEVETLCFGGVFLLRGQDNCTASKGRWMGPCTARARALKPDRALKMGREWVFQHDCTSIRDARRVRLCTSRNGSRSFRLEKREQESRSQFKDFVWIILECLNVYRHLPTRGACGLVCVCVVYNEQRKQYTIYNFKYKQ